MHLDFDVVILGFGCRDTYVCVSLWCCEASEDAPGYQPSHRLNRCCNLLVSRCMFRFQGWEHSIVKFSCVALSWNDINILHDINGNHIALHKDKGLGLNNTNVEIGSIKFYKFCIWMRRKFLWTSPCTVFPKINKYSWQSRIWLGVCKCY